MDPQRLWFSQHWPWHEGRQFYEKMYQWIWDGPKDIVDIEDDEIMIPKHRERLLRVCLLNKVLLDNADSATSERNADFRDFMNEHSKDKFSSIRWRDIRDHQTISDDEWGKRYAKCSGAFFYDFYAVLFYQNRTDQSPDLEHQVAFWWTIPLTFIFGPFYVISRLFRIALPLVIPFILEWNDWDMFQLVMWSTYLFVFLMWMFGMCKVGRREYYLWHILPTYRILKQFKISKSFYTLSRDVFAEHENITMEPVVRKMLGRRYGVDLSIIILMYLY